LDAEASSWHTVRQALGDGDHKQAERELTKLSETNDRATRAKAQLGLAQLAVSRGDCRSARAIALQVARTPALDDKLIERAHNVIIRCKPSEPR
jgi:uncharacterized protein HemY